MKKIKILLVSRSIPLHQIGGMELVAWDLALKFKEMGHKVDFLTTSVPNKPQLFEQDGVIVHALSGTKPGKYSSAWWEKSLSYFKNELCNNTDIVLSVSAGAYSLLNDKNDIPFIMQAHGTSLGEFLSKIREKNIKSFIKSLFNLKALLVDLSKYNHFEAFVAVGDAVVKDTKKFPINKVLDEEKIFLIKNGINTALFSYDEDKKKTLRKKYNIDNNTKVIISASRLHKQKGVHLGLKGFAKFLKNNPKSLYIIIGDGKEYYNLQKLAVDLKIKEKVIFTKSLNRNKLADYLNMGDLFLFTSLRNEGLPLNVLEALSSGLKVIISSHLEEITKISKEAVIPVNPESIENIAKAFEVSLDKNRKSYLPREYSLEYCASKYLELFYSLIKKQGKNINE